MEIWNLYLARLGYIVGKKQIFGEPRIESMVSYIYICEPYRSKTCFGLGLWWLFLCFVSHQTANVKQGCIKSHERLEKLEIEPTTPGLQGLGLV